MLPHPPGVKSNFLSVMDSQQEQMLILAGSLAARNVQRNQEDQLRLLQEALEQQKESNAALLEALKTPEQREREARERAEKERQWEARQAELAREQKAQEEAARAEQCRVDAQRLAKRQWDYAQRLAKRQRDEALTGGVWFMYGFCTLVLGAVGALLYIILTFVN
jgi:leucyl aminopeptidase